MARIFISYRRADTAQAAGRLHDALSRRFGPRQVFLDEHAIAAGEDFWTKIRTAQEKCDVVLVLIGEQWLGTTSDTTPRARIWDANDPVRAEVAIALELERHVIPVLVDSAPMPATEQLPENIRAVVGLNAARFRTGRDTKHDLEYLVGAIRDASPSTLQRHRVAVLALVSALAVGVVWFAGDRQTPPDQENTRQSTIDAGPRCPRLSVDAVHVLRREGLTILDVRIRHRGGGGPANLTEMTVSLRGQLPRPTASAVRSSAKYDALIAKRDTPVPIAHLVRANEVDRFEVRLLVDHYLRSRSYAADLSFRFNKTCFVTDAVILAL